MLLTRVQEGQFMKKCYDYRNPITQTIVRVQALCQNQVLLERATSKMYGTSYGFPGVETAEHSDWCASAVDLLKVITGIDAAPSLKVVADVDRLTTLTGERSRFIYYETWLSTSQACWINDNVSEDFLWSPIKKLPQLTEETLYVFRQLPKQFKRYKQA